MRIFVRFGVNKVRITGGEPLVRKDIDKLITGIREINNELDIALTTNGYLLKQKALKLKQAGLSRITVSLDSIDDSTYTKMNGGKYGPSKTLLALEELDKVGFKKTKINVVVQKGFNDQNFIDVAEYFRDTNKIVRFIEFMDVGNKNNWEKDKVIPASKETFNAPRRGIIDSLYSLDCSNSRIAFAVPVNSIEFLSILFIEFVRI